MLGQMIVNWRVGKIGDSFQCFKEKVKVILMELDDFETTFINDKSSVLISIDRSLVIYVLDFAGVYYVSITGCKPVNVKRFEERLEKVLRVKLNRLCYQLIEDICEM